MKVRTALIVVLGAALIAALAWFIVAPNRPAPPRATPRPALPKPAPTTLEDPLAPGRPMKPTSADRFAGDAWAQARPGFQYSRPAAERGGTYPCASQKVDLGSFEDWKPLETGHFIVPKAGALDEHDRFTLIVHLNGDEPARRELIESGQHFVLYALTIDPSTSYAPLFSGSGLLRKISASVRDSLRKSTDRPVEVGHVALSAWSAGFEGIRAILYQPEAANVEGVVLIDGLHAPRNAERMARDLEPFVNFAQRAARGERLFLVTHSSIDPPGYASTTEAAHFLVAKLGQKPRAVERKDAVGLELVESFSQGQFYVRGYAGNDKADHCAQLFLLRDAYAALGRYFAGQRK